MLQNSALLYELACRVVELEKTNADAARRLLEVLDADDRKTVMDAVRIFFSERYVAPCA